MKLRYYLRGLGIGVIVTALLMGFVTREKLPLTDAEIKARARALGMVESDSMKLSDIQQTNPSKQDPPGNGSAGSAPSESSEPPEQEPSEDDNTGSEPSEQGPSEEGNTGSELPETSEPPEQEPSEDGSAGSEPPESQNPSEPDPSESAELQTVTFIVKSGYSSDRVSKLLKEAGLVENAGEFDRFLVKEGYANRISVGTYEIEVGASMERIAKIITRSK